MSETYSVTAFYKFKPIAENDVQKLRDELYEIGQNLSMGGLTIVGSEGVNGTVAGSAEAISKWKQEIEARFDEVTFKDSYSKEQPFKRWFVKIRDEIVSLGDTNIIPDGKHNHLPPEEFERMMEEEDVVVLDTRNTYETDIGIFEGAVDPRIHCFQEFPEYVKNCDIPKDKKVLMYCTGGIRCEKACLEMEKQGYENVYQLDGGILRYMKERPQKKWKGECFVFDHRIAVDENLEPSSHYHLCPHCGDPGDVHTTCAYCKKEAKICYKCENDPIRQTCSKNCAHHQKNVLKKEGAVH